MSYEIQLDNYAYTSNSNSKVDTYYSNILSIGLYKFYIILSVILIVLNSVYPPCIMDLLEKIGVVTYVEFTNVSYETHGTGKYRSSSLSGSYIDHHNKRHHVSILVFLAGFEFSSSHMKSVEGAYYTFMPWYDMLRKPSYLSMAILYFIFFYGFYHIIKVKYFLKSIMTDFDYATLIKPISFGYEVNVSKQKKGETKVINYKHYVLWDTPMGELYENWPSFQLDKIQTTISYDSEYCGIFLQKNSGEFLIVRPEKVPEVVKRFNYKIDKKNHTVKIRKRYNKF